MLGRDTRVGRWATLFIVLAGAVLLGSPARAESLVDEHACDATGSYSRIIDGVPYTFWLIAEESDGLGGLRRYWHVERLDGEYPQYATSSIVDCAKFQPIQVPPLVQPITKGWKFHQCGWVSFVDQDAPLPTRYTLAGMAWTMRPDLGLRRFVYWHVEEEGGFGWSDLGSAVAECALDS